jgi:hypothetical protein
MLSRVRREAVDVLEATLDDTETSIAVSTARV